MSQQTLCLNMIVKNESHIIVGTLKHLLSVFPITYWVIDDTGSTDGTQTLIRDFFRERGISGELYETPWRDFGWNRTQAFAHAFNKTDYLLVWDADDSVVGQLPFPALLTADAYKLIFGNSSGFRYGRQQIFNNRRRWRYVGVLHEYPAPAEGEPPAKDLILEGNYWCESGRAGARNRDPNKYLRDAEVLERGLIDEPTNSRYAFYCANSYKDAGRNEQAIAMYKRVLTMNGWAEEKYLACVRIWELSATADKEAALPFLYESYQHVPDRVEGIYRLVEHFCHTKKDRIALGFYKFVSDFYENRYLAERQHISRHLFVNKTYYDYDLPYYVIISAIRCSEKRLALRMFDIIFRCGHTAVSAFHSNSLFFNLQFVLDELTPSFDFLQHLLAYREGLTYRLEARSEKVIEDVIQKHRGVLTARPETLPLLCCDRHPYILCTITSCKRLDLFTQTLNSMIRCWKDFNRITEFVCIDDNSSEADRAVMRATYPFIVFHMKGPTERGHRQSMNIIWSHLERTRPDYWIHLEDDWLFHRERSYVSDALEFLERHKEDKIDQILFNRNYAELHTGWNINGGTPLEAGYLLHKKSDKVTGRNCAYWPHYSFRPSMTRTSAVLALGNYDSPHTFFERDYADRWFAAGHRSAFFDTITCTHIGKLTSETSATAQNAYSLNGVSQFGAATATTTPKRFVVNLERRPDRRATIEQLFAAADLSGQYSFVSAVDGEKLTVTPEIQWLFTGNDFGNRAGVIGCALSHYRLWQQLNREDPAVDIYTIFEDDITMTSNFRQKLEIAEAEFRRSDGDILYLGRSVFSEHPPDVGPDHCHLVELLNKKDFAGGTFGYIIKRTGAKKLLDAITNNGICHGIDYVMKIQPDSVCSQMIVPPLVRSDWVRTQASTVDSDIQKSWKRLDLSSAEWLFYQGLDHCGDDIRHIGKRSPEELLAAAMANPQCVAVNTLGFLKNRVSLSLTPSRWFGKRDGIWIRRPQPRTSTHTRIKMMCNWCSPRELCEEFNKMTQGDYRWNNLEITWEDTDIDYWVIINKPRHNCGYYDPERTIIYHMEPWCSDSTQNWGVKTWGEWARPDPTKFLHVGSLDRDLNPATWQLSYSFEDLSTRTFPKMKEPIISSICSPKYFDPGHIKRIDFLRFIETQDDPAIRVNIYGLNNTHAFKHYMRPLGPDEKEKGIAPYKYYFMCENNSEKNYITEKLWEPILTETLCFYWGCPNADEWIDPRAFVRLNMDDFTEAFATIKRAIQEDWWSQRLPFIRAEKKRIMELYTPMVRIEKILESHK